MIIVSYVLLRGFWLILSLNFLASLEQMQTSDSAIEYSIQTSKLIDNFVFSVPGYNKLLKISASNMLLCLLDIAKYWHVNHIIILYQIDKQFNIFNSPYGLQKRGIKTDFIKWEENERNNHSHEVEFLLKNPRSFIIICCEASLVEAFLQLMNTTGVFTTNRNMLAVSQDDSPVINSRVQYSLTSHLSLLIPNQEQVVNDEKDMDLHRATSFKLFDVFNNYGEFSTNEVKKFKKIPVMQWDLFEGLLPLDAFKSNPEFRMGFKLIQTGIIHFAPIAITNPPASCLAPSGLFVDVFHVLSRVLHFHMNLSCDPQRLAGGRLSNGTLTGNIKRIVEKEIDISVNPTVITPIRNDYIRLHFSIVEVSTAIWFRIQERAETFSSKAHFSAFSLGVWLIFTAAVVLIALNIALALKTSPFRIKEKSKNDFDQIKPTIFVKMWKDLRWFIFGEFLEQAMEFAPGVATKVLLGTLSVTVTVIFLHYTSLFSSFLTSQPIVLPFRNVEELINNFNYKFGTMGGTGYADILEHSKGGLYQKMWEKMSQTKDNLATDITQGLKKVCTEDKYAFFFDVDTTSYNGAANHYEDCVLNYMKMDFMVEPLYVSIGKDFPYAVTIENAIIRMRESGVISKLASKYFSNLGSSINKVQANAKQQYSNTIFVFGLPHILIPIGILVTGIILSLLVLWLEITLNKALKNIKFKPLKKVHQTTYNPSWKL